MLAGGLAQDIREGTAMSQMELRPFLILWVSVPKALQKFCETSGWLLPSLCGEANFDSVVLYEEPGDAVGSSTRLMVLLRLDLSMETFSKLAVQKLEKRAEGVWKCKGSLNLGSIDHAWVAPSNDRAVCPSAAASRQPYQGSTLLSAGWVPRAPGGPVRPRPSQAPTLSGTARLRPTPYETPMGRPGKALNLV